MVTFIKSGTSVIVTVANAAIPSLFTLSRKCGYRKHLPLPPGNRRVLLVETKFSLPDKTLIMHNLSTMKFLFTKFSTLPTTSIQVSVPNFISLPPHQRVSPSK